MAGDAAAGKAEAEAEARAEAARGQLEAAGLALGLTAGATLAVVALVEAVRNRLGAGLALPLWAAQALALAPAALAALLLCGAPRPGRAPCSPRLLALGALLLALGAACWPVLKPQFRYTGPARHGDRRDDRRRHRPRRDARGGEL